MSKALFWLAALLSLNFASCSNDTRVKIYPVSGKVTYEGQPAGGAAVFFYRKGGDGVADPMVMGIVQSDGSFELVCGSLGSGAPAGEYDVLIEWKRRLTPNGAQGRSPDMLKGRYADPKHPLLHAKVEAEGTNQLPPFVLTAASRVPR